jgi:hypothetical protein
MVRRYRKEYSLPYFLFAGLSFSFAGHEDCSVLKAPFALGQWDSRTAVRHRVKQILARGRSLYVLVEDSTQSSGGRY